VITGRENLRNHGLTMAFSINFMGGFLIYFFYLSLGFVWETCGIPYFRPRFQSGRRALTCHSSPYWTTWPRSESVRPPGAQISWKNPIDMEETWKKPGSLIVKSEDASHENPKILIWGVQSKNVNQILDFYVTMTIWRITFEAIFQSSMGPASTHAHSHKPNQPVPTEAKPKKLSTFYRFNYP